MIGLALLCVLLVLLIVAADRIGAWHERERLRCWFRKDRPNCLRFLSGDDNVQPPHSRDLYE